MDKDVKSEYLNKLNNLVMLFEKYEFDKNKYESIFSEQDCKIIKETRKFASDYYNYLISSYTTSYEEICKKYNEQVVPNFELLKKYRENINNYTNFIKTEKEIEQLLYQSEHATKVICEIINEPQKPSLNNSNKIDENNKINDFIIHRIRKSVEDVEKRKICLEKSKQLKETLLNDKLYFLYQNEYPKLMEWEKIIQEKNTLENNLSLNENQINLLEEEYRKVCELRDNYVNSSKEMYNFIDNDISQLEIQLKNNLESTFLKKNNISNIIGKDWKNEKENNLNLFENERPWNVIEIKKIEIDDFQNDITQNKFSLKNNLTFELIKNIEKV